MRIISGKYKGRLIKMPRGIRPTQDKVRKALFDILGDIEGLSFLELFAGSGAVGLEALSQGAVRVVFVENNPDYIRVLEENINALTGAPNLLLTLDVHVALTRLAAAKEQFDIIFLDPPYYGDLALRLRSVPMASAVESLAKKTLLTLSTCDILSPIGFVIAQHFKKDNLPNNIGNLSRFKQARYGDTLLSFYRKDKG